MVRKQEKNVIIYPCDENKAPNVDSIIFFQPNIYMRE